MPALGRFFKLPGVGIDVRILSTWSIVPRRDVGVVMSLSSSIWDMLLVAPWPCCWECELSEDRGRRPSVVGLVE